MTRLRLAELDMCIRIFINPGITDATNECTNQDGDGT